MVFHQSVLGKLAGLAARLDSRLDSRGSALVEFAFIAPILVVLTLLSVDLMTMMFDYHRAGEATRRAARTAAIVAPIVDVSTLAAPTVLSCQGTGAGPSCPGATITDPASFDQVLADVRGVWPAIAAENLRIEYRASGIGSPATPGGILPMVTVRLNGVRRSLGLMAAIPGVSGVFDLPEFAMSHLGNGNQK